MRHLVIRAPQLKAKHRLQILSLQQHLAFQPIAQIRGVREWCFFNDFVDFGCEDQTQILSSLLAIELRVRRKNRRRDSHWAA
jgi:hypothetical protein